MKKILTINLILSFMILFCSCAEKPKNPFIPSDVTPSTYGQQTAIVDSDGENNVAFFDFSIGTITHIKHDVWDIAFSTSDLLLMIANSGSYGIGVKVTNTGSTAWSADYSGKAGNIKEHPTIDDNPLKDWRNDGGASKRYVYLAKDEAGATYKFQVDSIAGSTYKLIIDTLAGTSTTTIDVIINSAYDYIYVDLGTKKVVSFAPPLADWDIKFGQTEKWTPAMGGMWIGLSAISENIAGLVKSCLVKKNIEDVASASGLTLSANLIIAAGTGSWYDWTGGVPMQFPLVVIPKQTYVVQTIEGNYAKFQMLTYNGPNNESFYSVFKFYYQDGGSPDFSH